MSISMSLPKHSAANGGATSVIRKKLKFTNETLWKQFSSRRLQLVESLSLSSKKASEQDEEIKLCAKTLMEEFNFPVSTLSEFDKLVRLAIQSVRRNKKRSEKRLASKLETLTSDEEQMNLSGFNNNITSNSTNNNINNVTNSTNNSVTSDSNNNTNISQNNGNDNMVHIAKKIKLDIPTSNIQGVSSKNNINKSTLSSFDSIHNLTNIMESDKDHLLNLNTETDNTTSDFTINQSNNSPPSTNSINFKQSINNKSTLENQESRSAVNSLIEPIIQDVDRLPSLKKLEDNSEFNKYSQKILHLIKSSKSCYDFSKNSGSEFNRAQNYNLLEEFGSNCITSAILYTLEKWFDHLLPDSSSYIKLRLKSDLTLGLIIKNLDKSSIEVNTLSNYVASQLFKKLIGGCVKDYGFDETLNPLCDIFHNIILKDYPIITKRQIISSNNSSDNKSSSGIDTSNFFKDSSSIIDSTINKPMNSSHVPFSIDPFPMSPIENTIPEREISHNQTNQNELPDFPLSTAHIPIPPISDHNSSSHLLLNNLPPPILRSKQYTQVIIKFNDKELKCRYCMNSNAPPTLLELISNCKQAFGIFNSSRIINLKNIRSNKIIKTDHELERILRMASMLSSDGNGEVMVELVFANSTQGYLNLNYENDSKINKQDDLNNVSKIITNSISNNNTKNNDNIKNDETGNKTDLSDTNKRPPLTKGNSSTESSNLISRYLPPPRPIRPDVNTQMSAGFMKFQPLL